MKANTTPVIEVQGLRHAYGQGANAVLALSDIALSVAEGSFVSIVGPSGCGKSTLLQILAGLLPSTSGEVRIDGHTDKRPIFTAQFPSNWELSTARAVAVAKYLISRGLPPERMVTAGYAEFRPLDPADNDEAYNKNRRIEFKLDQR